MSSAKGVIEYQRDPAAAPDNTGAKQDTRFRPGQSGNPKGRPRGARSKLGEDFLQALSDDFQEHGVAAIKRVRERSPEVYLKIVKDILPREAVLMAFNIHKDMDEADPFSGDTSIEGILALVAQEAGEDAAVTLASMFQIEYSRKISRQ